MRPDETKLRHINPKIVIYFQIARRSAIIKQPIESPWHPVTLDAFDDLVASKMTALIDRGAPRDFVDIYEICNKELVTISRCWKLWQEREIKRGISDPDQQTGCEAVLLHLSRIERSRPIEKIVDSDQRDQANKVRMWYKKEFCKRKI